MKIFLMLQSVSAETDARLNRIAIAAAIVLLAALAGHAQSLDDLKNDGKNPDNVLTYGMGY